MRWEVEAEKGRLVKCVGFGFFGVARWRIGNVLGRDWGFGCERGCLLVISG